MELQQIKNKIDSKEYDFLRNDIHLGNNIILLTLGGSYAYGLENENSDLDIRGIAIENKNEIIGLKKFEQVKIGDARFTYTKSANDQILNISFD